MLVLTRKIGEKLIIGDEIIVQVLSVSGDQVKIGIQAPSSVSIHRNEVYESILINGGRPSGNGTTPFLPRNRQVESKKNGNGD
jgi:carbon storage regulator CsrA